MDKKICKNCDTVNTSAARFCVQCGESFKPVVKAEKIVKEKSGKRDKSVKEDKFINWPLVIGGIIAVLLIIIFSSRSNNKSSAGNEITSRSVQITETRSKNPEIEAKVLEIAEKFNCSCGSCDERSLEVCTCATAVGERNYIRLALQIGQESDSVIYALNEEYGSIKHEYIQKYGKGKSVFKLNNPAIPLLDTLNNQINYN